MSDDDSAENKSRDKQRATDEKSRIVDTPEEDPRGDTNSSEKED